MKNLFEYPLLSALNGRRSRRFGKGMSISAGPFAYQSQYPPTPLTEDEEAALVFAACGITGYALADLAYGVGEGGSMLAGIVGRTVSSPDAINTISLVVINDEATYFIKRPQNLSATDIGILISLAQQGGLTDIYRQSRVKLKNGRSAPPVKPGYNFNINKWSVYAQGGSYFLPINEMTASLINALLEGFEPEMGLYFIDERRFFQPAGIKKFAKSKGGHLDDNPKNGRVATIQGFEMSMAEAVSVEQGMVLQNLGLMTQALGLGGFANFARHEYGWFDALGFQMGSMPVSQYGGASRFMTWIASLLGQDLPYPYPLGLTHNGEALLHPFCPPFYKTMKEAVYAFVEYKFGQNGVWREQAMKSDWKDSKTAVSQIKPPSQKAIDATIAYCEYVHKRYGRFPAYPAPLRTIIGYQATQVDPQFYDKFFKPEALTQTQRNYPPSATE